MKSKLETYALTVCLVAVVALMISGGIAVQGAITGAAPELMLGAWSRSQFRSNDDYWAAQSSSAGRARPTEAELSKERESAYARDIERNRLDGIQELVRSLSFSGVAVVVLWIHWRLARRVRTAEASATDVPRSVV